MPHHAHTHQPGATFVAAQQWLPRNSASAYLHRAVEHAAGHAHIYAPDGTLTLAVGAPQLRGVAHHLKAKWGSVVEPSNDSSHLSLGARACGQGLG